MNHFTKPQTQTRCKQNATHREHGLARGFFVVRDWGPIIIIIIIIIVVVVLVIFPHWLQENVT